MQFARVRQFAQVALTAGGGATLLFTGTADDTEVTAVHVVWAANGGKVTLYHDDDGTTYTAATAVWTDQPTAPSTYSALVSPAIGSGIGVTAGGALAASCTGQNCTVTVYGVVEDVPEEA